MTANENYFQHPKGFSFDTTNCIRMPNDIRMKTSGSNYTENQAYFGVSIKPYCFGTA